MTTEEIIKRWGAAKLGCPERWEEVTVEFESDYDHMWSAWSAEHAACEVKITRPQGTLVSHREVDGVKQIFTLPEPWEQWNKTIDLLEEGTFVGFITELVAFAAEVEPS